MVASHAPENPESGDTGSKSEPRTEGTTQAISVLVMNHSRDSLGDFCEVLSRSGYSVQVGESLAQSHRLVQASRPDLVILNPLVLCAGGVELELIEALQQDDDPIPLILMVDDLETLAEARQMRIAFRDFLLKPFSATECVHRVEIALNNRSRFRGLHTKARLLESQVSIDFKTGLTSDRYFRRILDLEWKRAQRHQNPLSLLLIDVDNFKSVNDTTEYAFGDEVLRRVADALKANIRETDFAARFGGDEFCILLPQTSPAEAVQTALRIRQRIANMVMKSGNYERHVTVSIGIDSFDGRAASSLEHLNRNANRALQEAKHRGKDQVWLYSGSENHNSAAEAHEGHRREPPAGSPGKSPEAEGSAVSEADE